MKFLEAGGWQYWTVTGQEMAEGSDGWGSEWFGAMEEGGGSYEDWNVVQKKKSKKTLKTALDDSERDGRAAVVERRANL